MFARRDMAETGETRLGRRWDAGLYDGKHAFVWKHGTALLELLAPRPGERILDLGCGTGHLTAALVEAGATAIGLDHSPDMLARARSAYPHVSFVQGDARDFAFPEPFDAVLSNAVLHWVRPPEQVVARVRAALKPGGRFVAELGGRGNVGGILAALRSAAGRLGLPCEPPSWYFPTVGEYASLLESAGLEVSFAALFDRPTPLEGASGLRDWVAMFAPTILDAIPTQRREEFLQATEETAQPTLFRDGTWQADYRRLRIVASRGE
jgi:trans-aconitate methyltransferase